MAKLKVTLDKIYQFETGIQEGRRLERLRIRQIIIKSEWIHPKLRQSVIKEIEMDLK
jgi:hypothetical protein